MNPEQPQGVKRCHICASTSPANRQTRDDGLADGKECPICYAPTCRYHLATVRWRWRNNGKVEATRICQECKRSYRHRSWDPINRDWIS